MQESKLIMYTTEDGLTRVEVTFDQDTVWLSIDQMAELFQRDKSVIGKHVRNIFKEGELNKNSVWAKFAYTASDGKVYQVDYYNLDVIISVGYRVKSLRGTQFRIWASSILKEYMKKGFALDDDRLKRLGGGNYFDDGYCYYLISSDLVRRQLSMAAQQTKIRHTSPEKIMDCEVFIRCEWEYVEAK